MDADTCYFMFEPYTEMLIQFVLVFFIKSKSSLLLAIMFVCYIYIFDFDI